LARFFHDIYPLNFIAFLTGGDVDAVVIQSRVYASLNVYGRCLYAVRMEEAVFMPKGKPNGTGYRLIVRSFGELKDCHITMRMIYGCYVVYGLSDGRTGPE
jgi:hypothetical protein